MREIEVKRRVWWVRRVWRTYTGLRKLGYGRRFAARQAWVMAWM